MSLNGILNSAATALQVNQAALKTTSQNIANVNTDGYHRRVVNLSPGLTGTAVNGVTIEEIRRITDSFLSREAYTSSGQAGQVGIEYSMRDRANAILGKLDGGASLINRLSDIASSLGQLAVDPASSARRITTVADIQNALSAIGGMSTQIQSLRQDANTQLSTSVTRTNALLTQISDLNSQIKLASAQGDTSTGLLDQRDRALSELSGLMDIQTSQQADGRIFVSMNDGTQLISDLKAQLSYVSPSSVSAATSFPSIQLSRVNVNTGATVGPSTTLEGKLQSGTLRGLLDMRDSVLPNLAEQLGAAAGSLADGLNALHNGASAVPAPSSLTGTNTGLLGTDALNFTGKTTIAVTDNSGALIRSVEVDFSAGTLAVNGGGASAIGGGTINDLTAALNAALGADGSVTFSAGVMSVSATASNTGVSLLQDATAPSQRGGRGFGQVFGLNDLVRSSVPVSSNTGLTASDAHGFTAGGTFSFALRAPSGQILTQGAYTVAGATVNDLVTGLNTAASGFATFSLDTNGAIVMSSTNGARLEVNSDTTARGATNVSVSQFFALGTAAMAERAQGLTVRSDIRDNPTKFAAARLDISSSTLVGDIVLGKSDNRAAQDLAALMDTKRDWSSAGGFSATQMSIMDYAGQIVASQAQGAQAAKDNQDYRDGVVAEVKTRKTSTEGVNLDEELTQMIVYQQAYNAAARIMSTVQDMYDTLISIKR